MPRNGLSGKRAILVELKHSTMRSRPHDCSKSRFIHRILAHFENVLAVARVVAGDVHAVRVGKMRCSHAQLFGLAVHTGHELSCIMAHTFVVVG